MTETFRETTNYNSNHCTFGGFIYYSDFNTDYRKKNANNGSTIAQRIISDKRFDMECMQKIRLQRDKGLYA